MSFDLESLRNRVVNSRKNVVEEAYTRHKLQ
jgi:hypothetical protein